MVNVSHNGNERCTGHEILFLILEVFDTLFNVFLFDLGNYYGDTELIGKDRYCILVQVLVDVCHDTHLHESHDDGIHADVSLLAETAYGDGYGDRDGACRHIFKDIGLFLNYLLMLVLGVLLGLFSLFKGTHLHGLLGLLSAVLELAELIVFLVALAFLVGLSGESL